MKRHGTQGFMMAELLIAVALLGTVLALSYQTLHHALGTWSRTERKWLAEQEVNRVLADVESNIRLAYEAEILEALPDEDALDGNYSYLYLPEGGDAVWFLAKGETPGEAEQISELPVALAFERAAREGGGTYSNALRISVSSAEEGVSYGLETVVHLPNIQGTVAGENNGLALRYALSDGGAYTFNTGSGINTRCFVATASYGADTESVLLLRRFRDGVLLSSAPGRRLVALYYQLSPPLARVIAQSGPLRLAARIALLPFVGAAVLTLHPAFSALVMAAAALLAAILQKVLRKPGNKSRFYKM